MRRRPLEAEARFGCTMCGKEAGHIVLSRAPDGHDLVRKSFTSTLSGGGDYPKDELDALRGAIERRDVGGLFRIEPELTPFYCPECDACYCDDHWSWWSVFEEDDPGHRDSIRGRCPEGHERMLED